MKVSKYRNKKVSFQGEEFDSKREMQRYIVLKDAESKGVIQNLQKQVNFELIPKIEEEVVIHLKRKDKIQRKTVQLPIIYRADFVYEKDGVMVVEDVKISDYLLPKDYILKEKLFRWKYGFSIKRVYKPNDVI
jgi:hypothetical protein